MVCELALAKRREARCHYTFLSLLRVLNLPSARQSVPLLPFCPSLVYPRLSISPAIACRISELEAAVSDVRVCSSAVAAQGSYSQARCL